MNIRNFSNSANIRRIVSLHPAYGRKGSFPIDQTPAMPFNVDPATGRPMSDIQKLVKIQDSVNQQAFLSSLKEFKSNFLPKDMSDDDALVFLKSRHQQTKSELLDYRDGLTRYQLHQQELELQRKQMEEQRKADAERDAYFNDLFSEYKLKSSKHD